jgi:hypothetical protein
MALSVFDKYRIVLLASEGCLNRDHVDLLLLNPASAAGIYPTHMTLIRGDQEGLFKLVTLNGILNRIIGVTFGC